MKVQIISDLHLEFLIPVQVEILADKISNSSNADVLILAGDICALNKKSIVNLYIFLNNLKPYSHIIYVLGNHEYYSCSYGEVETVKNNLAPYKKTLSILENESVVLEDITFYGTTLWFEETVEATLKRYSLNDYKCIKDFTPDVWCRKAIKFIKNIEDSESKKVLITHHVPHSRFISPKYIGDELNCFYLNEIGQYLNKFNLVIFGHSHDSVDQQFSDKTRAVSNPRGYINFPNTEEENDRFNYQLIVEI